MAQDKTDKTYKSPEATNAKPKKVAGLLDAVVAEADGEEWEYEFPVSKLSKAAADNQREQELITKGQLFEIWLELQERLNALKPTRGRPPKGFVNIDVERAAAVLGADDLCRDLFGTGAPSQKQAIELATWLDKKFIEIGKRDKPIFDEMTTLPALQNSVSRGLKRLGIRDGRFTK